MRATACRCLKGPGIGLRRTTPPGSAQHYPLDFGVRGQTSDEIGRALYISKKTVESHRLNIRNKLKLKSALELVRQAMDWVHRQPP